MAASLCPPSRAPDGPRLVLALCQVVFDVDVGQKVEAVYPPGVLSREDESSVAFHAFPDSMSMELRTKTSIRDCSFFFRVRQQPGASGAPQCLHGYVFCRQRQDERLRRGGEQKSVVVLSLLPLTSVLVPLSRFLGPLVLTYGPDTLQQVFEEVSLWPPPTWGSPMTLPLGEMGAITAHIPELSTLPGAAAPFTPGAGSRGASRAGSPRAAGGRSPTAAGRAADGAAGAGQQPGAEQGTGQSGLVGAVQEGGEEDAGEPSEEDWWLAELDDATGLPLCLLPQAYGQQELVEGPFAEVDAYTPLRHVLQQLWTLWELLVLGEPLLVAAATPGACSSAVAALLSLLAPLPFACDWRPYLTIHDPCFAPLASGTLPSAKNGLPCLLGLTNLYVIKALPVWPNVLSTGYVAWQQTQQAAAAGAGGEEGGGGGGAGSEGGSMRRSESGQSVASNSGGGNGGLGGGASRLSQVLRRRPQGPQALLSEPVDSLWLSYKPYSRPDKEVLNRLAHPHPTDPPSKVERAAVLNTMLLRRHFQELTQALLFPLLPYISPAPPPSVPASPMDLQSPPPLLPLDPDAILENLADRAGTVPDILLRRFGSHKTLVQFYERFLACANLQAWLQTRRAVAEQWQARVWHAAWWKAGGPLCQPGTPHMGEVVAVEEFFELEQRMEALRLQPSREAQALELRSRLRSLFASFPPDLQASLRISPRREAWLDGGDGWGAD